MTIYRYDQEMKRLFVSGMQSMEEDGFGSGAGKSDEAIELMFQEVLRDGVPAVRTVIRENAGEASMVAFSFMPEYGPDGAVMSVIGIAREKADGNGGAKSSIERLEEEKRALLKEVHHRVNNNLQIIESLLRLQADRFGDPKYLDMLGGYIDRIHAISMIQKRLYRGNHLQSLKFGEFVEEYADYIRAQYPEVAGRVEITRSVADVGLTIETAVPCALILNELVDNSLRYGFPGGRRGRVDIIFRLYGQYCVLEVLDNGVGFDANAPDARKGFGLELVSILTGQLRGSAVYNGSAGSCCTIAFRLRSEAGPAATPT